MRRKYIAGNWKMNMLPNAALSYIENLIPKITKTENEVILCVPYTDLFYALLASQETHIKIGAQNMHWEDDGAFTGEISGKMLKSIGVEYVIIGHSERRKYFNETDETINLKIKKALECNLKPIVCVGETEEQRNSEITEMVISKQIEKALEGVENLNNIIIAYEPIWAIGTGKTATPQDANNTIKFIRSKIKDLYNEEQAENIIIQYGGSVKPSNAKELFEMSDIDGALIGGASLNVKDMADIINYNTRI